MDYLTNEEFDKLNFSEEALSNYCDTNYIKQYFSSKDVAPITLSDEEYPF